MKLLHWRQFMAAIAFYTCLPVPAQWSLEFERVAVYAPLVGLLVGGLLGLLDGGLQFLGMPIVTRSAVVVGGWIAITGGLHLDGVMDTADGLAVPNPERRLQVMADSATGAFGAMAGIVLLFLKTAALSDLSNHRWWILMVAAGWGRWGQVIAIALYPYLKPTGKGAFHKVHLRPLPDLLFGGLLLLAFSGIPILLHREILVAGAMGGGAIALMVGAWFNRQLGGHTGDSYGAVVEWTEALILCWLTFSWISPR
jgi:adenosylcobinamide-GDP ribazoletransferase